MQKVVYSTFQNNGWGVVTLASYKSVLQFSKPFVQDHVLFYRWARRRYSWMEGGDEGRAGWSEV